VKQVRDSDVMPQGGEGSGVHPRRQDLTVDQNSVAVEDDQGWPPDLIA